MAMVELTKVVRRIENKFKLRVLCPEYEILSILYEHGRMNPAEILSMHHSASSTFYAALKRLHAKGLIISERDSSDGRLARYSISAGAREMLDAARDLFRDWAHDVANGRSRDGAATGPEAPRPVS